MNVDVNNMTKEQQEMHEAMMTELWFVTLTATIATMKLPADQIKAAQLAQARGFLLDNGITFESLNPMRAQEAMQQAYTTILKDLPTPEELDARLNGEQHDQ
ncbi:hypothetical protein [Pseudodesulfovibrio piezophilus]|uniref:Uncharacterized protein n=1 Tax=Pseudodesulfovibrio piezophilus (strain DSM 21447 / JCM 15486 / C1TLV30) TaxID=1322246 RepID=M1WJF4_PSEP2|nr:hypothetical protein [Pseudodesulfovibrio piezophilus]CCH47801.1 protein of unknown function [Pseudodesulfovibrio piezophilus C1TLV30]